MVLCAPRNLHGQRGQARRCAVVCKPCKLHGQCGPPCRCAVVRLVVLAVVCLSSEAHGWHERDCRKTCAATCGRGWQRAQAHARLILLRTAYGCQELPLGLLVLVLASALLGCAVCFQSCCSGNASFWKPPKGCLGDGAGVCCWPGISPCALDAEAAHIFMTWAIVAFISSFWPMGKQKLDWHSMHMVPRCAALLHS